MRYSAQAKSRDFEHYIPYTVTHLQHPTASEGLEVIRQTDRNRLVFHMFHIARAAGVGAFYAD